MKIAVDAGPLAAPGDGIARYLASLLAHAITDKEASREWWLYGRRRRSIDGVLQRCDHLPSGLGRVAALCTTLPAWAAMDRPDVFWGPAHRLPCRLPRDTARVVTIHDLVWLKAPETMRRVTRFLDSWFMPRALSQADRIIAVSSATAADLRAAFPQCAERVVVVHSAATTLPPPRSRESLHALGIVAPYVLYVGTQEPRKNLRRLIAAFEHATQDDAAAQLVIAGAPGWGGGQIESTSRIRVLGRVGDQDLATLYRHAVCLALPSLYEGFGLPLVEALAQGTPVLYGNNSSMPEVAGDAGLAVDANSVESIAQGLARLLGSEGMRTMLAARATAQASKFSWDRAARETLAVFDEALAARRAR